LKEGYSYISRLTIGKNKSWSSSKIVSSRCDRISSSARTNTYRFRESCLLPAWLKAPPYKGHHILVSPCFIGVATMVLNYVLSLCRSEDIVT